jgi:hypothetical protein
VRLRWNSFISASRTMGVVILTIDLFLIKSKEFFTLRSRDLRLYTTVIYDIPNNLGTRG